jgi:hypothetical protein
MSGNDSDVMITDEIQPKVKQNTNTNKKTVFKLDRKHSTSTNSIKEEDTSNGVQQTEDTKVPNDKPPSAQPLSKKDKKKSKAEKRLLLSNPDKIVKNVLSKSSFKVPNLSQIVDQKFSTPHLKNDINNALKSITYEDTTLDVNMSILPSRYSEYTVNVDPCAITYLPCMYELPERRKRHGSQGGNRKRRKTGGPPGDQQKQKQHQKQPQQKQQQPSGQQQQPRQQQQQQKQHQHPGQQQQQRSRPGSVSRSDRRSSRGKGFRNNTNRFRRKFDQSRLGGFSRSKSENKKS